MTKRKRIDFVSWITILASGAFLFGCGMVGQSLKEDRLEHAQPTSRACQEDEVIAFDGSCTHPDTAEFVHGKWYPLIPPVSYVEVEGSHK